MNDSGNNTSQSFITNNKTSTREGDKIDNSITFNAGAIQITCQNASEEEARRMADIIIERIKRQRQIDDMTDDKTNILHHPLVHK